MSVSPWRMHVLIDSCSTEIDKAADVSLFFRSGTSALRQQAERPKPGRPPAGRGWDYAPDPASYEVRGETCLIGCYDGERQEYY